MTWAGTGTSIKQMRLSLSAAAAPSPQAGARSHSWPLIVQSTTSSSSISCSKARMDDMSASVVPFPFSLGISRMTLSRSWFQAQVLRCSSSPAEQSWSFIDGQRWSEFHSCHFECCYYQSFTGWKSFPKQQSSTSSWWSSLSVSPLITDFHFHTIFDIPMYPSENQVHVSLVASPDAVLTLPSHLSPLPAHNNSVCCLMPASLSSKSTAPSIPVASNNLRSWSPPRRKGNR